MKTSKKKEINILPHPKDNPYFVGHDKAVQTLTEILNSKKIPQSWLITGPKGIGKATLVYRFTRALLAHAASKQFGDRTLDMLETDPTFTRIANGSHSDLMVLEPDDDKATKSIKVDSIRKISDLLRLTASETRRRIVIIDSADDMNPNAANALLKLLEEPPKKAVFLLISHAPGRLLPTIKSRCRSLNMNPLSQTDAAKILLKAVPDISHPEADKLTHLSGGSPGVAIDLHYNNGIKIYEAIIAILQTAPNIDPNSVLRLGDLVTKKDDKDSWGIMAMLLDTLLIRIIKSGINKSAINETAGIEEEVKNKLIVEKSLENLIEIWEKVNSLVANTSRIHLDKRAVIISIFVEFDSKK